MNHITEKRAVMMHRSFFLLILFAVLQFLSCESPYMVRHPVSAGDTYYLYASFYSDEFNGRTSADGSAFNNGEMTCAARGFPFSTYLEVQSIDTGKKVTVKVTDRPGKNVIDLSKAAFSDIDSIGKGKIKVKVTVVEKPAAPVQPDVKTEESKAGPESAKKTGTAKSGVFYTVQLGAFPDLDSAKKFSEGLKIDSYIFVVKDSKELFRVRSGRFSSKNDAEKFKSDNCSNMEAIVVEVTE